MTLAEIIAKILASAADGGEAFDGEKALNGFVATKLEGINNKNAELLTELKTAKAIVSALPEGFTPEAWAEMSKALEGVDLSKLSTPEQVEAVTASLKASHATEVERLTGRESTLTTQLQRTLVDSVVAAAISKEHGNSTLLAPHVAQRVSMVEKDGEFTAVVVDDKGAERYSLVEAGELMSIGELVNEFKVNDTYASAFAAGAGGGGGGGGGGKTTPNPFRKGSPEYSLSEQGRITNENPTLAGQLKTAATAEAA